MDLQQYIMEKSKELNIDIIGFTDNKPLLNLKDYLIIRKEEKRQTEFEEADLEKRINPNLTFSDCKTIIVVGLSYNNDFNGEVDYKHKGIISKSSWGLDYHIVLRQRIEALIKEIQKVKDFNYKYFVDTGPLIDRELAKKAGVGSYGKNCSIINDEYGSFIFLGYILTNLKIENNSIPSKTNCGDCNKCIKACPTGALESPYKFNPKKCISYLTQTKERIPYELRSKMGTKIYGCDTCQLACPKNKDIKIPNHEEFLPLDTKGYINIEELLSISNKKFKEKYGSMAGSWRGKNIFKRNGIIALGNMKNKDNLKLLEPLLKDSSPMIREYVIWTILNIDYQDGKDKIEKAIKNEKDQNIKLEMKNLINYFFHKNIQ